MTNLIETIRAAWGWLGLDPSEVVGENEFGNLMVKDMHGKYWRICPEEAECTVVANNRAELDGLAHDRNFLEDWSMRLLVEQARDRLGSLPEGRKYCLAIPAVLGGNYDIANVRTISLIELISVSGDLARQLQDLPDGTKIRLKARHSQEE